MMVRGQYTWAHARDNVLSLARLDRFYGFNISWVFFKSFCHFTGQFF